MATPSKSAGTSHSSGSEAETGNIATPRGGFCASEAESTSPLPADQGEEDDLCTELIQEASMEIRTWLNMLRPAVLEATYEGVLSDPCWGSIAPSVFQRLENICEAIFYARDRGVMTELQLEKVIRSGMSFKEVCYE